MYGGTTPHGWYIVTNCTLSFLDRTVTCDGARPRLRAAVQPGLRARPHVDDDRRRSVRGTATAGLRPRAAQVALHVADMRAHVGAGGIAGDPFRDVVDLQPAHGDLRLARVHRELHVADERV